MSRTLAIASGKGGAGKTSLAVNLAFALAASGGRVCLLDADLGLSNADILLGVTPKATLEDVLFSGLDMTQAVTPVAKGVDLVAGSSGVARLAELTRPARARLARQFAALSGYDWLLVDNSPGISRQVTALCLACRELLVVVNPEAASMVDAYALIKVLKENGQVKSPGLVVNRAESPAQARDVFNRLRAACAKHLRLDCRDLGAIPRDPAVVHAAALRRPLLRVRPDSPAARAFAGLAHTLRQAQARDRSGDAPVREFIETSLVRLLEAPPPQAASAPPPPAACASAPPVAPAPASPAPQVLADIDAALDLAKRLRATADPKAVHAHLETLTRRLQSARQNLGGSPASEPSPAEAPLLVTLVCEDPELGDVMEEALTDAGMRVSRRPSDQPPGPDAKPQVLVVHLDEPGQALRSVSSLRLPERPPLVLVESFARRTPALPPASRVVVLPAPLRVDALIDAVRRQAGR